ncbi:2,3-bisphosphoglycerate-independent phosphoglycerate mutase [bacterium]|nr:2,3-bisphosphoglycerate-independent phosphoglycerate mutase [bacterium]
MTTNPVVLIILDGWGISQPSIGNALTLSNLEYWNFLIKKYPVFLLQASGEAVGLPYGEMGNSEVGHITIGSGQIVLQSLNRINKSILSGDFFQNEAILKSIEHAKNNNSALHLMGLLGTGGVHAYQAHLESLIKIAADNKLKKVYLHLFLDGRDTKKDQGVYFLEELQKTIDYYQCGKIATLAGRFYGMDRNNNWDRIQKNYETIVQGKAKEYFEDPILALQSSYAHNIFDENFKPIVIGKENEPVARLNDDDALVFFNFRSDRARQITKALISEDFDKFDRGRRIKNLLMVTFTEYQKGLPVEIAFQRPEIKGTLAQVIDQAGLKQLHIAETEKYAHVTFFFNGLREEKFTKEGRILIPSPNVETYDLRPEMSTPEIAANLIKNIESHSFDFGVANFANPDMVGHTGNLQAAIKAVESVDNNLTKIIPSILAQNGTVLLTADHGNVEEVINLKTGEIDKEHSNFPVPLVIINKELEGRGMNLDNQNIHKQEIAGVLSDIAPTVLGLLKIKPSSFMKGINLIKGL